MGLTVYMNGAFPIPYVWLLGGGGVGAGVDARLEYCKRDAVDKLLEFCRTNAGGPGLDKAAAAVAAADDCEEEAIGRVNPLVE